MASTMTTYNTGAPVPSTDVRDLYDNAENLDNFSNGAALAYADRKGVSRQSLAGIRAASQYTNIGAYGAGLLFTSYNQTFSYLGEFYAPSAGLTLPYTTTGSGAGEIATFRSVGDAILRSDLANTADPTKGAALSGYKLSGTGTVARTVFSAMQETVQASDFGLSTASSDNTAALQAVVDYCATFVGTGLLPRVVIAAGEYQYADSPNWALTGMHLVAAGEVVFKHTGTGIAFNVDGGATGPGVYGVHILGGLRISGNANTTIGLYSRAVHHSKISVRPINCTTALQTEWNVCNEFDVRCSPAGYPSFSKVPTTGILLGRRGTGETTSACIFTNPVLEGIIGYGISLQDAVQNRFIGGTSESNGGGIFISATSSQNSIDGLDMEFNSSADIFCQGTRNTFDNVLSDSASFFSGQDNIVIGGLFNSVTASGTSEEFISTTYASAGGAFTDSGSGTVKRGVRNLTTGLVDAELDRNPHKLLYIYGPAGNGSVIGSSDQLAGGSANDLQIYHYGSGEVQIVSGGVTRFRITGSGVGFQGAAPLVKPTVAGSRGGNAALASLITALANYGLITDSSTA